MGALFLLYNSAKIAVVQIVRQDLGVFHDEGIFGLRKGFGCGTSEVYFSSH